MKNYLVYLGGDGDVSLIFYAKDEEDAERQAYEWIKDHNYNGDIVLLDELTPPDEEDV